jgi:hypothetical protein
LYKKNSEMKVMFEIAKEKKGLREGFQDGG